MQAENPLGPLTSFTRGRLGLVCLLIAVSATAVPLVSAAASSRLLFLAPSFFVKRDRAVLHVNPPETAEIVIRPDRSWETGMISFWTTVIDENGRLRLWYICRDRDNRPNLAYAESSDGISWTKPNLGIVDYHGSKANNLVGITEINGTVFRDPQAKPGEEYVYLAHDLHGGLFRYTSPDGLHWQRDSQPLLPFRVDTQSIAFWDEWRHGYALYVRAWDVGANWHQRLRKVAGLATPSLSRPLGIRPDGRGENPDNPNDLPRVVDEIPTVLRADALDGANTDVYNISAQLYPVAPSYYLGFPSFFHRDQNISDGRLEVQFVGSRDGVHWERYDRAPYIRPGLADSASANVVFIGPGMVVRGDELWQFGTGYRNRHGAVEKRKEGPPDGVIYRYMQRIDGFVSLDFDLSGGSANTKPVEVTARRLLANVDTGALGELRIGLIGADGKPVPGFSVEDCDVIRTNATGAVVSWKGHSDVSDLAGQSVSFELRGARAKLFSLRFQ